MVSTVAAETSGGVTVIDASLNPFCWLLSCGIFGCSYSTILKLHEDEIIRYDKTLCGERMSIRPYGDLGSIETGLCCCFVCADSNLGTVVPGFGCDRDAVEFIVLELTERVAKRGEAKHLVLTEQAFSRTLEVEEKMERVSKFLLQKSLQIPSPQAALTMDDR